MSEVYNNGVPNSGNYIQNNEQQNLPTEGNSFQGEKTDLRYDPNAAIKKTWINKPVRTQIGNQTVEIGPKQINQVKKDLNFLNENPAAVQRATALFPALHSHAKEKGVKNPDSLALALEHYAASKEFIDNTEVDYD